MSDHFAPQLVLLIGAIAFIGIFVGSFNASMGEAQMEKVELSETTEFEETWLTTGDNWGALEDSIPSELFIPIILTIIILGAYIAFKTVSGALPNWLSGG